MALQYTTKLGALDRLKNDIAFGVRRQVFELFMRELAPGPQARVADFGVSGHRGHPVHYFFETLYPHRNRLTAIGQATEGAAWLPERFPGLTFLEADLCEIPVPDDHFAAGICNAVVEHAGTREQQRALIHEVSRVCRNVLFTTPNRWFPIELHTFLPLLHWLPDGAYRAALRRLGFRYFADVRNLNLLDATSFIGLFPTRRQNRLIRLGLPFAATNLICISRKTCG